MSNENSAINFLNYEIKDILNWKAGKRAKNSYKHHQKSVKGLSCQLFVEQYLKYRTYDFGRAITYWLASANKIQKHTQTRNKTIYTQSFSEVIKRYSIGNLSLLKKIDDLNKYDFPGIYILCLDDIGGYYVGQTSVSIKQRIKKHYQQLNSKFDKLFGHNNVKSIYALKCPSNMLNRVEQDIIASIPTTFLLNGTAGGASLEIINEATHLYKKYAFTLDELEIIKYYLYKEEK